MNLESTSLSLCRLEPISFSEGLSEKEQLEEKSNEVLFHLVQQTKEQKNVFDALLKRVVKISSSHSIFSQIRDWEIDFPLSEILDYIDSEMGSSCKSRLIKGSVAFALRYFDSIDQDFNDIDFFIEANASVEPNLMKKILVKFLRQKVIPKLETRFKEQGKLKKKESLTNVDEIIDSFFQSTISTPTFFQLSFGSDLDITFSKQPYDFGYRCVNTDSIAYDIDSGCFRISNEGCTIEEVDAANLKGSIIARPLEKVERLSNNTIFYYMLLWSFGFEASSLFIEGVELKFSQILDSSGKFDFKSKLTVYLDKHFKIIEEYLDPQILEARLCFLLNIIFFVQSSSKKESLKQRGFESIMRSTKKVIDEQLKLCEKQYPHFCWSDSFTYKMSRNIVEETVNPLQMIEEFIFLSHLFGSEEPSKCSKGFDQILTKKNQDVAMVRLMHGIAIMGPSSEKLLKRRLFLVIPRASDTYSKLFKQSLFQTFTQNLLKEKRDLAIIKQEFRKLERKDKQQRLAKWLEGKIKASKKERGEDVIGCSLTFANQEKLIDDWKTLFLFLCEQGRKNEDPSPYLIASRAIFYLIFAVAEEKKQIESLIGRYYKLLSAEMIKNGESSFDLYRLGFLSDTAAAAEVFLNLAKGKNVQDGAILLPFICEKMQPVTSLDSRSQGFIYSAALRLLSTLLLLEDNKDLKQEVALIQLIAGFPKASFYYHQKKHPVDMLGKKETPDHLITFLRVLFKDPSLNVNPKPIWTLLSLYKQGALPFAQSHKVWEVTVEFFLKSDNPDVAINCFKEAIKSWNVDKKSLFSFFGLLIDSFAKQPSKEWNRLCLALAKNPEWIEPLISYWTSIKSQELLEMIIKTTAANTAWLKVQRSCILNWIKTEETSLLQASYHVIEHVGEIISAFAPIDDPMSENEMKASLLITQILKKKSLMKMSAVTQIEEKLLKGWLLAYKESFDSLKVAYDFLKGDTFTCEKESSAALYWEFAKAFLTQNSDKSTNRAIELLEKMQNLKSFGRVSNNDAELLMKKISAAFARKNYSQAKNLYFFAKKNSLIPSETELAEDLVNKLSQMGSFKKESWNAIQDFESIFSDLKADLSPKQIKTLIEVLIKCRMKNSFLLCLKWTRCINPSSEQKFLIDQLKLLESYQSEASDQLFKEILEILMPSIEMDGIAEVADTLFNGTHFMALKEDKMQIKCLQLILRDDVLLKDYLLGLTKLVFYLNERFIGGKSPHLDQLECIKQELVRRLMKIGSRKSFEVACLFLPILKEREKFLIMLTKMFLKSSLEVMPHPLRWCLSNKGSKNSLDSLSVKELKKLFRLTASIAEPIAAWSILRILENPCSFDGNDLLSLARYCKVLTHGPEKDRFLKALATPLQYEHGFEGDALFKDYWEEFQLIFWKKEAETSEVKAQMLPDYFAFIAFLSHLTLTEIDEKKIEGVKKDLFWIMISEDNPYYYPTIEAQSPKIFDADLIFLLSEKASLENGYHKIIENLLKNKFDGGLLYLLEKTKFSLGLDIDSDPIKRYDLQVESLIPEGIVQLLGVRRLLGRMRKMQSRSLLAEVDSLFRDLLAETCLLKSKESCLSLLPIDWEEEIGEALFTLFDTYLNISNNQIKHYLDLCPYLEMEGLKLQSDIFGVMVEQLILDANELSLKDNKGFFELANKLVYKLYEKKISGMQGKNLTRFQVSLFCLCIDDSKYFNFGLDQFDPEIVENSTQSVFFLRTLFNSPYLVKNKPQLDQMKAICKWSTALLYCFGADSENLPVYFKILEVYKPESNLLEWYGLANQLFISTIKTIESDPAVYLEPLEKVYRGLFNQWIEFEGKLLPEKIYDGYYNAPSAHVFTMMVHIKNITDVQLEYNGLKIYFIQHLLKIIMEECSKYLDGELGTEKRGEKCSSSLNPEKLASFIAIEAGILDVLSRAYSQPFVLEDPSKFDKMRKTFTFHAKEFKQLFPKYSSPK